MTADAAFDEWFNTWYGRYPSPGQAAEMRLGFTKAWEARGTSLDAAIRERDEQKRATADAVKLYQHYQTERDALRAALEKYGRHIGHAGYAHSSLRCLGDHGQDGKLRHCTCGFSAALASPTSQPNAGLPK